MSLKNRPCILAANWKMHKTIKEACQFVETLASLLHDSQAAVYLAVPYTALYPVAKRIDELKLSFKVGAQNMFDQEKGAFTGEISSEMLKDAGASFVILGHSERRTLFHESNEFISRKVISALNAGLQPLLCVGESAKERIEKKTENVLKSQLLESLRDVSNLGNLILAYEPLWAIGTGVVAKPEDASEAHRFLRKLVGIKWGSDQAERLVIQYGGSVKPENAKDLLNQPDVDGLLIGGASLSAETFSQIINTCKKVGL